MNEINLHISALKQELNQVLFGLNGTNDFNFEDKMNFVIKKLEFIKSKKEELILKFNKEDLEKFNPDLDLIIKEISVKFDNMVTEKVSLKNKIGQELKTKQNEKKLVNYKR